MVGWGDNVRTVSASFRIQSSGESSSSHSEMIAVTPSASSVNMYSISNLSIETDIEEGYAHQVE